MDARVKDVGEIRTALLFDIVVDLQPKLNFGDGPVGRRISNKRANPASRGSRLSKFALPIRRRQGALPFLNPTQGDQDEIHGAGQSHPRQRSRRDAQ
jgi:hypothetical protein